MAGRAREPWPAPCEHLQCIRLGALVITELLALGATLLPDSRSVVLWHAGVAVFLLQKRTLRLRALQNFTQYLWTGVD